MIYFKPLFKVKEVKTLHSIVADILSNAPTVKPRSILGLPEAAVKPTVSV